MTVDVLTVTCNPAIDQTLWIPGFRVDAVNRVSREQTSPGGKGVNVAAFLSQLGHTVGATGLLGRDNAGLFERFLAERGIGDGFVRRGGSTRTGVKVLDEGAGTTTDINFPGDAPTPAEVAELEARVGELAQGARWVVLAGSLPPAVPPDLYARLIEIAHVAGAAVALDTSGPPLVHALAARPELVKPNRDELAEVTDRPLRQRRDLIEAAHELQAGGVGTVIVSLGADGSVFVAGDEVVAAAPLTVDVVSTVGAGDAMVAGAIAGSLRGLSLTDTAALATACSAAAISGVGPRLAADVLALAPAVKTEHVGSLSGTDLRGAS